MSKRFVVKNSEQVDPERDSCYVLVDTKTNEIIGEYKKNLKNLDLVRDLDWVPYLLNKQQEEIDRVHDLLGIAASLLQGDLKHMQKYANMPSWKKDRDKVLKGWFDDTK